MQALRYILLALAFIALPTQAKDDRNLAVSQVNTVVSEKRIALVIGNSAYTNSPLKNPVNDAKDMANKLRKLGFEVIERKNLQTKQIGGTLREFRSKLVPGAVALVFYAGHGLQIKGENYLPAVDADINSEEDVPNQSLAVKQIMDVLDEAKTRLNLVFLDACRNNPYARSFRSADQGLARISAPSGTLISYATRPGSVAADGSGRNGLYTSKLLAQMDSNLQIEQTLKRVVTEVKAASQGKQEPWMEGSIEGDFCFAGCNVGEPVQLATLKPEAMTTDPVALESSMPNQSAALLSEVVAVVDRNYVTQPDLRLFLLGALRGVEKILPSGAISVSQTNNGVALAYVAQNNTRARVLLDFPKTSDDLQKDVIFGASLAYEIAPSLEQARLEEAMLNSALANLDPHSSFLNPEQLMELKAGSSGSFGGVGLEVGIKEGAIKVVAPIENAPAERAGIRTGDHIVAINGTSTKDVKLEDAVKQMRGFPATSITLSVMREGWNVPRDFVITREIIRIQSVRSRDIESGIGYIAIRQFNQGTPDSLQAVIDKWSGGFIFGTHLRGIVLDLRNNPGGLLNVVVEVAGKFLDDGRLVVTAEGRSPESKMHLNASGKKKYADIPMVVLVNEGSASGTEILAGALQDSSRAIVVGNRTFGKGMIQTIIPLSGGAAVKLSTSLYRTPSGRVIEGQGIEPNVLVPMPSSETLDPASDIQLQQALTQLKMIIGGK